jgi:hypothetical protein
MNIGVDMPDPPALALRRKLSTIAPTDRRRLRTEIDTKLDPGGEEKRRPLGVFAILGTASTKTICSP